MHYLIFQKLKGMEKAHVQNIAEIVRETSVVVSILVKSKLHKGHFLTTFSPIHQHATNTSTREYFIVSFSSLPK